MLGELCEETREEDYFFFEGNMEFRLVSWTSLSLFLRKITWSSIKISPVKISVATLETPEYDVETIWDEEILLIRRKWEKSPNDASCDKENCAPEMQREDEWIHFDVVIAIICEMGTIFNTL